MNTHKHRDRQLQDNICFFTADRTGSTRTMFYSLSLSKLHTNRSRGQAEIYTVGEELVSQSDLMLFDNFIQHTDLLQPHCLQSSLCPVPTFCLNYTPT